MKCPKCMVKGGKHDILCPKGPKEMAEWRKGYEDGYNGDDPTAYTAIYKMGYKVGRNTRGESMRLAS